MNSLPKSHQTEILRKTIRDPKSSLLHRTNIDDTLREQLRKRQQVIDRMYKRSVANKLYIFPKMSENPDDISLGSNQSIDEMDTIERYKLSSQNHQSTSTVKNGVNYFSQNVMPDDQESKAKIDLRKFRTKIDSNKKVGSEDKVNQSLGSGRINPHKLLFKAMDLKKKQEGGSVVSSKGVIKSKRYTSVYQDILNRIGIQVQKPEKDKSNSSSSIIKKGTFTYRKKAVQGSSQQSGKDRYRMSKQQVHNVSVTRILQKYRSSSKKKDIRCKTEY